MQAAAKDGDVLLAVNIAERAAPYYDRKLIGAAGDWRQAHAGTLEQLIRKSMKPEGG